MTVAENRCGFWTVLDVPDVQTTDRPLVGLDARFGIHRIRGKAPAVLARE